MTTGNTAIIGKGESVAHMIADRDRLTAALESDLPEEKRAEVVARLAQIEANLADLRTALGA